MRKLEIVNVKEMSVAIRSGILRPGSQVQINMINRDLRKGPGEFGYDQNLWDGKLLNHHISEKFSVNISVRTCQLLFHRHNFGRRKPSLAIAKGRS